MKLTLWSLIANYRKVLALINLVKEAYADKNLTKAEVDTIALQITNLLRELGVLKE